MGAGSLPYRSARRGGTGVLIDGVCAPLYFVSPNQINQLRRARWSPRWRGNVAVRTGAAADDCRTGAPVRPVPVRLRRLHPSLFTTASGEGPVAAVLADGTPLKPAAPGPRRRHRTPFRNGVRPGDTAARRRRTAAIREPACRDGRCLHWRPRTNRQRHRLGGTHTGRAIPA
jgi:uncharacterized protein (TIGR03437 family)